MSSARTSHGCAHLLPLLQQMLQLLHIIDPLHWHGGSICDTAAKDGASCSLSDGQATCSASTQVLCVDGMSAMSANGMQDSRASERGRSQLL
jgi:hypothetical protein